MENIEQNVAPVIEETQVETVETVSTQEDQQEQTEWKAPQTKEELDKLIKSAENKTYTKALKELGVKSVKDFLEYKTELDSKQEQFTQLEKDKEEYTGKLKTLESENITLKQERILDKLIDNDEYRDEILKLASSKIDDSNDFEKVLNEMANTAKYEFMFKGNRSFKMGTEKNQVKQNSSTYSSQVTSQFPWLK